ncbi:MAG: flagellar hook assembly protein FlgD [Gammaproteobacteria bacterium]|nr:flagellar hook assembly protein FlgD [Sideroxydans sp.]MBU3904328.1 flagellar hook assembly protein FlgD [Gammaproteobacteria bacterium]MBU4150899.1 flagellar hook assembly protein FlgD [Gammaproteobacteria bacterium]
MVDSVQNSTSVTTQTSASKAASEVGATQDRFLKLLVTQMKNQDPLNPLDNAQVTSQMAQLSTVTGIDKLNATVQALSANMTATQSLQAASMIGHVAMVPGKQIDLFEGNADAAVELMNPADKLTVTIEDAKGNAVRTLQLGAQDAGIVDFKWDGLDNSGTAMADGNYKFIAQAELSGKKSDPTTLSYGLVDSVTLNADGAKLSLGNRGDAGLDTVRRIL